MFENQYPASLSEDLFENWLEIGRNHKAGYYFLVILWDEWELNYKSVFIRDRDEAINYHLSLSLHENLVAVYDLYSESRIS